MSQRWERSKKAMKGMTVELRNERNRKLLLEKGRKE
jgi:hypothetical protein